MQVITQSTELEAANYLTKQILHQLEAALSMRKRASLVVAGGKTFQLTYQQLVSAPLEWSRVDLFFGDERCVAPDHEWSNYKAIYANWLHIYEGKPGPRIYRIKGELDYDRATRLYDEDIWQYGEGEELPIFDVVLLGFGPDGHTASLFASSLPTILANQFVVANVPAGLPPIVRRITLTPRTLERSRATFFLGTGEEKAAIAQAIIEDRQKQYPVSHINCLFGEKVMILDQKAASRM